MTGKSVAILGSGAFGTALALAVSRAHVNTILWGRDQTAIAQMQRTRMSSHLPECMLPKNLTLTSDLFLALNNSIIILALPAQATREFCEKIAPLISSRSSPPTLVVAAKGIELTTGKLMSQVVEEILPYCPLSILSGPSFASEVARGLPTAITIAAPTLQNAQAIGETLGSSTFRPYASDDLIGAQVGGAFKNVVAIAAGVTQGRQLGENARATILTRGLTEMLRLGRVLGAKEETFFGLSGIGDLALTCSTTQSRNMRFGYALGSTPHVKDVLNNTTYLTEGVHTATALVQQGKSLGIEMPIAEAVYQVLNLQLTVDQAIEQLLTRSFKSETLN